MFEDINKLWNQFLDDATIYFEANEEFYSPTKGGCYKITNISRQSIKITRQNVDNSSETIGFKKFETCVNRISSYDKNNKIPKNSIYEHVAEETILVNLLPMLDWSNDGKWIIVNSDFIELTEYINEAQNDNVFDKKNTLIRLRKGQNKFRENILKLYNRKCAISGCSILEILDACHINPHFISGINKSTNGILLRTDIHDLFDLNLLGINPLTKKIVLHSSLKNTEYECYNGNKLLDRIDGKDLDNIALLERWNLFLKK